MKNNVLASALLAKRADSAAAISKEWRKNGKIAINSPFRKLDNVLPKEYIYEREKHAKNHLHICRSFYGFRLSNFIFDEVIYDKGLFS